MNRINHETEGFKCYFLNSVICMHLYYAVTFSGSYNMFETSGKQLKSFIYMYFLWKNSFHSLDN